MLGVGLGPLFLRYPFHSTQTEESLGYAREERTPGTMLGGCPSVVLLLRGQISFAEHS